MTGSRLTVAIRMTGVLCLGLIAAGCGDSDTVQPGSTPVVIYIVDTLRADRLGFNGYERRATSPRLDELARRSVVFERAYAPSPWTLPSVVSLVTSKFVCEHGVTSLDKRLNESIVPFAERLQTLGYYTGSFYFNPQVSPITGLDRGFVEYEIGEGTTNEAVADVRDFLEIAKDRPFYLNVHTMEPHDVHLAPYGFVRPFGHIGIDRKESIDIAFKTYLENQTDEATFDPDLQARIVDELAGYREEIDLLYDASVRWADKNAGDVVDALIAAGVWDDAIYVFLSDHGEELSERGGWFHGQSVYEELARVPLFIHFPGDEFAGRRVAEAVSLVDVIPTIYDYLDHAELCEGCRGQSLMPLVRGLPESRRGALEIPTVRYKVPFNYRAWQSTRGDVNVVILDANWKGIWNDDVRTMELYDLAADPSEATDLSSARPEISDRLALAAGGWLEDCRAAEISPERAPEVDEETRQKLRALGYFD